MRRGTEQSADLASHFCMSISHEGARLPNTEAHCNLADWFGDIVLANSPLYDIWDELHADGGYCRKQ